MKNLTFVLILLIAVGLGGCIGKMPQTADEFREVAPGAFMAEKATFEVDRPLAEVGKTFKKYAPKCLDVRLETTSKTNTSSQYIVTKYTPTVAVTAERAEIHVQEKHEKGVMAVYEEPEAGHYLMVVDATSLGKNKTQIEFYRPSMGFKPMVKAIENWAHGKNLGCPDLTKM